MVSRHYFHPYMLLALPRFANDDNSALELGVDVINKRVMPF